MHDLQEVSTAKSSTDSTQASTSSTQACLPERRPGELGFLIILVVFSVVALWQSWLISDFDGPRARRLAAPGIFPILASAVMLVSSLFMLVNAARTARAPKRRFIADVTPTRLIVVAGLLVLYVMAMPGLGFVIDSALFLFVAFLYLWERPWWQSLLVSLIALGVVWLVFRLVFQVVLPQGNLDRWLQGVL